MNKHKKTICISLCVLSALIGAWCIVASWSRLSRTADEGTNLAAGLEWWQDGRYTVWTENPPLPRIASASLPYASGERLPPPGGPSVEARRADLLVDDVLCAGGGHQQTLQRTLVKARAGSLPFYLLAVLLVALLAARGGGWVPGSLAAISLASLTPFVAHASLVTSDVAFVAMLLLALLMLLRWLERPDIARAACLGAAVAGAVACKFTALMLFPAVAVGAVWFLGIKEPGAQRPARRAIELAMAFASGALLLWALYGFTFGWVDARRSGYENVYFYLKPPALRQGLQALFTKLPLPAPDFFHGLLFFLKHNERGHLGYLMGEMSQYGFAAFYPVALFLKAPLAYLLFVAGGILGLLRRSNDEEAKLGAGALGAAALTLTCLSFARVNIGVRHALVVYALLSIAAAIGWGTMLRNRAGDRSHLWAVAVVSVLLIAQQVITVRSTPNQLSFFNGFAGVEPGRWLIDSDLDWGQGRHQLMRELQARQITRLAGAFNLTCVPGMPPVDPIVPRVTTGWIAVSEHRFWKALAIQNETGDDRDGLAWLSQHAPVWKGAGMRLYFVAP